VDGESEYALGIDPDLSGAVVLLRDGMYVSHIRVPTREHNRKTGILKRRVDCFMLDEQLGCLIGGIAECRAFMEWAPVVMENRGFQVASQHRTIGDIEAVLACHGIDAEFVTAREWQKSYNLIGRPKNDVIPVANQLCGTIVKLKKDVSVAETAMIGRYGFKYLERGETHAGT